jgi:lipid-binding SYLF domain-containing protein
MHKIVKHLLAQLCLATTMTGVAFAADIDKKLTDRLDAATAVIHELMATPDKGVPQWVAAKAKCVAVVPGYKKGAFVVGGQYGQGLATCRTAHGWSAPVFMQITGASFGFQAGGQSTDLVLVGTNHKSMQDMMKEKVKLGGDAAASAGPVGRNSQASISALANAEFLTYSRSKGLFAGLDLTGDYINQNKDDTKVFYGKEIPYSEILSGKVPTPPAAHHFEAPVAHMFRTSKAATTKEAKKEAM